MQTDVTPSETQALTLYAVEGWVEDLQDTEGAVTPEQQQAFELELSRALESRDRTERVAQSIRQIEAAVEFGEKEIDRIRKRCNMLENIAGRLREGVLKFIIALELDGSARFPKLKGRTLTMSARSNPPSVEIKNLDEIPVRFKTAKVEMPLELWQVLVDAFPSDTAGALKGIAVDKRAVKAAMDKGENIAGVDVILDRYCLMVR